MGFTGHLATFSLPEIFQTLERGRKTGCLSLLHPVHSISSKGVQHLWFSQGQIMAASDALNQSQLLHRVIQRRWLSQSIQSHWQSLQELETPLGLFFKNQGLLKPEQLQILFHFQVLQRVSALVKWQNGQFKFDEQSLPPPSEMTGLSISPSTSLLLSLRVLKDWKPLTDKLPQLHSALARAFQAHSSVQLDFRESKVFGLAQGTLSLQNMAQELALSIENIQLRLPIIHQRIPPPVPMPQESQFVASPQRASTSRKVTQSFVHHLLGFLRSKV